LFVAGVNSGKTRAGAVEILRQPAGSVGAVIGPTKGMLSDSTIRMFLDLTRAAGVLRDWNKTENNALLCNGTTVMFRSADEPDRLRGPNLGWFWMDEGALCSHETWLIMLGRLREVPSRAWVTTTPRGFNNWIYNTFVKMSSPDYAVIRSSTRDNIFRQHGFIERLEAEYPILFQRQEIDGEFVDLQGSIFRREWFDVVQHAPDRLHWCRFWDLASSVKKAADFSASVCAAFDNETGDVFIQDAIKLKAEWPEVRRVIIETACLEPRVELGIESAVHGLAAIQELRLDDRLANTTLRSIRVDKDKVSRALPVASRAEAHKLKLVAGNWVSGFIDELTVFPSRGAHDDLVDATSGAFGMISSAKKRGQIWISV
jgi:predicted phage terminase large subunit-like protein